MMSYLLTATAGGAGADVPDWMSRWLDVTHPWEAWWLFLGLTAQGIFFARWVVQWVASERRGESVVPTFFWWCSLLGATLLLIYFIGRHEPIGVLGQVTGWMIYGRNLYLIQVKKRRPSPEPVPGPPRAP